MISDGKPSHWLLAFGPWLNGNTKTNGKDFVGANLVCNLVFEANSRPGEFSRRLEIFPVGKFGKNPAHRLYRQARICIHNFSYRHARGE